jgi:tyrosine-protein phosphatase SIW14
MTGPDNRLAAQRPAHWAEAVPEAGVPNLYRFTDSLYRSAQPDLLRLDSLGFQAVLNLRFGHADQAPAVSGLQRHQIRMYPIFLQKRKLLRALKYLDTAPKPLLVHCKHGADRTGAVVALYRIIYQHWSKKDALKEMKRGGYGYHRKYFNIPLFIRCVRVEKWRKRLGIYKLPS